MYDTSKSELIYFLSKMWSEFLVSKKSYIRGRRHMYIHIYRDHIVQEQEYVPEDSTL